MSDVDPSLIRLSFLTKAFKSEISSSGKTMVEISQKMGITQPAISSAISGTRKTSDNVFLSLGKAIGLTHSKIQAIFEDADREYFKHKYGKELDLESDYSADDLFLALQKKEGLSDKEIFSIKSFFSFILTNSQD